mmetsp:Transcript_113842/g.321967  ORF Transcript_113842/g.321967 Transcript_113842/m.321967 type:complete len:237 (-) Transcript_113842:463-1173(-)
MLRLGDEANCRRPWKALAAQAKAPRDVFNTRAEFRRLLLRQKAPPLAADLAAVRVCLQVQDHSHRLVHVRLFDTNGNQARDFDEVAEQWVGGAVAKLGIPLELQGTQVNVRVQVLQKAQEASICQEIVSEIQAPQVFAHLQEPSDWRCAEVTEAKVGEVDDRIGRQRAVADQLPHCCARPCSQLLAIHAILCEHPRPEQLVLVLLLAVVGAHSDITADAGAPTHLHEARRVKARAH